MAADPALPGHYPVPPPEANSLTGSKLDVNLLARAHVFNGRDHC
jgi:hypothetical protein